MGLYINIGNSFRESFENKCFRLITESYNTAMDTKIIKINWDENDITAELQSHIRENPLRLKWRIHTNVEKHIPTDDVVKEKGYAAKLPRIDLGLASIISGLEYEYHMEAKNLKEKSSTLKRRYIDTGINNFLTGKYKNGCLLGYNLEGHLHKTVYGINRLLKKDERVPEYLNEKKHPLHDKYYESNHPDDVLIKHFMFDFTSLNSA